ncbi:MAG: hypothetical protein VB084_08515 [Syntrophomonadaceae bacterium]|nr:hypothetical protein [Syntrophomonadaceae bacterium]
MKVYFKFAIFAVMVCALVLMQTTIAKAVELENQVQLDVSEKNYIEQSFEESKAPLEVDKMNWGLSEAESFADATLGAGIPFYIFSEDFLNSKQGEDQALILAGYVFPIKSGEKPVGIAVYRYTKGKLTKAEMGNISNFEQEVIEGKNILKAEQNEKLIYDRNNYVIALAVRSERGYDLLPILSTRFYGLQHYQLKPLSYITDELRNGYQIRKANPGKLYGGATGTGLHSEKGLIISIFIGVIIAASIGALALSRKKGKEL